MLAAKVCAGLSFGACAPQWPQNRVPGGFVCRQAAHCQLMSATYGDQVPRATGARHAHQR
jgi:hypothetical protein